MFYLAFVLYSGINNGTLVAGGRIELPTPCFSDKGKPCDLVSVYLILFKYTLFIDRLSVAVSVE